MLRVIVIDDEEAVRESIKSLTGLFTPMVEIVGECSHISEAVSAIRKHKPHVLLLDVELGTGNGFELLREFPNPAFKVIFITAHQHYALEAFRFAAVDYLLKPLDPDQLIEAINRAWDAVDYENLSLKLDSLHHNLNHVSKESKRLVLRTADEIHVLSLAEVVYCVADRGYTTFHLTDGSHVMVSRTIGEYEEMLSEHRFFRIHQSYLVNLDHLKRYEKGEGGSVVLKSGQSLPVATRKKEHLLQWLSKI